MLKRSITYTDFNNNKVTEVFYFNLTRTELIRMDVSATGGLHMLLQSIVEEQDPEKLYNKFEEIILAAYGQKSEDGKRHVKSEELRIEFSQTAAFDALVTELTSDIEAAATFIKGVIPANLAETPQDKPTGPPLPPVRQ